MIGLSLIICGGILLAISTKSNINNDSSTGEKWNWPFSSGEFIDMLVKKFLLLLISIPILALLLVLLRHSVYFLVSIDWIPAREFPGELTSGLILGILVSVVGYLTNSIPDQLVSVSPIRTDVNNFIEAITLWIFRRLVTLCIGMVLVGLSVHVVSDIYTPIQFIITPSVVQNPLDLSQWQAPRKDRISILFSTSAAVIAVFYFRFVEYTGFILDSNDTKL